MMFYSAGHHMLHLTGNGKMQKGLLLLFMQTVFSARKPNIMFVNLPPGTNIALNLDTRRMFQ